MDKETLKRALGRPLLYKTPKQLENRFIKYVESLEPIEEVRDSETDVVTTKGKAEEQPSVTGLALYLGFADKCSLYDYGKREEFSHSIKVMRTFIEYGYEKGLSGSRPLGSIFALKCNYKWRSESVGQNEDNDIEVEM